MTDYKRKFGRKTVEIKGNGNIIITDDFYTNYGVIYPHNIENLKNNIINPVTGYEYQVIGMDNEINQTIKNWIYSKIKKGLFDHLINK